MTRQSRTLTMLALLALIALVFVNVVLGAGFGLYGEWFAWAVFGLEVAAIAFVLRYQRRLGAAARCGLLALPFIVAVAGAII